MTKKTKIWLITAALLITVGCVIFVGVMSVLKWDFLKLSTVKFETNDYSISESFKNITVVTDTADVVLVPSETGETAVVCYEQVNVKHSISVRDETLRIEISDSRRWYEHIGISFRSPKITVYIPAGEYGALSVNLNTGDVDVAEGFKFESIDIVGNTGDVKYRASASGLVKIKTSTGKIEVKNVFAGELRLSASTGNISVADVTCEGDAELRVTTGKTNLTNLRCKNVISSGSTGNISLNNVVASEKISVKRSTGDVVFDGCDAATLTVKTDTGNVKGSLLSDKVFIVRSDTGNIDVPKTAAGGICDIETDTGDIKIVIQ